MFDNVLKMNRILNIHVIVTEKFHQLIRWVMHIHGAIVIGMNMQSFPALLGTSDYEGF